MDTRTKIVSAAQAAELARSGATVVSGYFDPLVASTAERLAELKKKDKPLLVLIRSSADAILPARARAELVAALAVVNFVCYPAAGPELDIDPQVRLEEEHSRRLKELVTHVHARQKAALSGSSPS